MDIELHARQLEIFQDTHPYKIVAAGRRFGKSYLAAVMMLAEASKSTKIRPTDGVEVDLLNEEVFYVGPTQDQSKKIMWPILTQLGDEAGIIERKQEMVGVITLTNGRRISIKGSDRPDNLRGTGLSFVVLDEYAFMKPHVWEVIIEPQLARSEGEALFIGTPDGKNHFFELYNKGMSDEERWNQYQSFHYPSTENPYLTAGYIEAKRETLSKDHFAQEYEADFESGGGSVLTPDMFEIVPRINVSGNRYIAIDLAGFQKSPDGHTFERLDEHAIAVVIAHRGGWLVERIIHGQWDTRETALRIVKAFRDHKPLKIGIEKGMAKNAVVPYLEDEQARLNTFFHIDELTHGNQRKQDRIAWALQGRAEKGRIQLLSDDHLSHNEKWLKQFLSQIHDFPSLLSHDDLVDALSYIDQLADPVYDAPAEFDWWQQTDSYTGY